MTPIRWGIIGCGDVTEVKSGPAFDKVQGSGLVAVMRRNGALAAAYAARHGVPRWTDDADRIIRAPDIDAVYVATPPDTHCEYTQRCAAAGKPVYVEKPMAMDHRQCTAMVDVCRERGVPLWVAYYRRALPRFLRVRELLSSGAIGEVRMAVTRHLDPLPPGVAAGEIPWRYDGARGGGIFFEGAVHTLDFLDFLFGPIQSVEGVAANPARLYPAEDVVLAQYRFAGGVLGSGVWWFSAPTAEEYTDIVGTVGTLRFSTTRPVPIQVVRGGQVETHAVGDPPHVQQPLIQTIVDELRGRGRCPSTGESAARTAWVVDRVLGAFRRSASQGT